MPPLGVGSEYLEVGGQGADGIHGLSPRNLAHDDEIHKK